MIDHRLAESWTWYAVVAFVILLRFISRAMLLEGFKHFQLEDYLMILTFGFYTNLTVWINIQTKHPRTNILPDTGIAGLSPADIQDRVYGSKVTFITEQSMILIQWGCKACLILFYYRLTQGLKVQNYVKIVMGYIAFGWIVVEVFFYGIWCRPFLNYFVVKESNSPQCETSGHHLIMSYVFNVSTDVLMLLIPLPILYRSQLAWKKKIILCGIFSLGLFVILAATLNRYYCFAHPESILWIFWYVREAGTAMIVTNLPNCYVLLHRLLDVHDFGSLLSHVTFRRKCSQSSTGTTLELGNQPRGGRGSKAAARGNESESTENITREDQRLRIWQQKDFAVEDSSCPEDFWGNNPSNLQHLSFQATATGPSSIDFRDDQADSGRIL